MTTMWDTGKISIGQLMDSITASKIALPAFQRPSVWGRADWVPFLTSVLLDRPTGTLLLMDIRNGNPPFSPRAIDVAIPLSNKPQNLEWLILDGQQRSTTLFKALKGVFAFGKIPKHCVLNIKAVIENDGLNEMEHITFERDVPGNLDMARRGAISLNTLLDDGALADWERAYGDVHMDGAQGELVNKLNELLPGFRSIKNYQFPVLEINQSAPLDVVVEIFEGMNRRGQKLKMFDLMVARLYHEFTPGVYYDLREEWKTELSNSSGLKKIGVSEDDGMLPLQLIALQVSRHKLIPGVTGLKNKDVLEVPATEIIGLRAGKPINPKLDFGKAVTALDNAADFLSRVCGVTCKQLLPQLSMLIPIADQYLRPVKDRLSEAELKIWFFAVGISVDYYGSVNSYAERDCKDLAKWASSTGHTEIPASINNFNRAFVNALDLKQAMRREGAILGASLMSLLVSSGALDWKKGQISVEATKETVDFHHMIPEAMLKKILGKDAELRPIAVMTPITANRNRSLGDKAPLDVIEELGKDAKPILATHQVEIVLLQKGSEGKVEFEKFLDSRERLLKAFIIQTLGL